MRFSVLSLRQRSMFVVCGLSPTYFCHLHPVVMLNHRYYSTRKSVPLYLKCLFEEFPCRSLGTIPEEDALHNGKRTEGTFSLTSQHAFDTYSNHEKETHDYSCELAITFRGPPTPPYLLCTFDVKRVF